MGMTTQYEATIQLVAEAPGIYPGGTPILVAAPANSGMISGDIVLSAIVDPASAASAGNTGYVGPYAPGANIPLSYLEVVTVPSVPRGATVTPAPGVYLGYDPALGPAASGSPPATILLLLEHP
jgi:hypothetical protein